jgi:hypothetical protein
MRWPSRISLPCSTGCYTNMPRSHDVDDQFGTHRQYAPPPAAVAGSRRHRGLRSGVAGHQA